ncbi:hypothetical protein ACMC9I_06215 [Deinococcota bacterium DY0809b]
MKRYGIGLLLLFASAWAAGGLDLAVGRNMALGGYSGVLGFYVEGQPLAARGRLLFGERGGLMGGLDLLYRPWGRRLLEPYAAAGAATMIARLPSEGGFVMDVGSESYAVVTLGLALNVGPARPYAELSYNYGAAPYARAGLGMVWRW